MSTTQHTKHDDEELALYVLGLLPSAATERLDEASIVDDEVAARMRVVETDLIDSYVRGQLDGATLARFEAYYLSSARRQESVRVAARFVRALDRSVAHGDTARSDRVVRPMRLSWIVAAAALVIAVSGFVLFEAGQPRNERRLANADGVAIERPEQTTVPPVGEHAAAKTTPETIEGRSSSASASTADAPTPERSTNKPAATPGGLVAVVLLPPTRGVAPIPTLAVPSGADRAAFELRLESNDFSRYRVELKNPATDRIVWRSDWIAPSSSAEQASVSVVVPANLLRPQHYSLDLTGRGTDGRAEVIGSYTVRIVQP